MWRGWIAAMAPLAVLAATLWATRPLQAWLARRAILDRPVERSSHEVPVPRGGGLAVVPPLLLVWLLLALAGRAPMSAAGLALIAGGLAALSWLDDLRGLPVVLRLLGHLAAVAAGLALLGPALVFQGLLPPLLDRVAAALLWTWFVNLYNFMDGIDGIAGVETAALGLGIALVLLLADDSDDGSALLALSAAAGALGFLRWNWQPARIFLGDVGSVPLGYLLGALLLVLAGRGLWVPALILPLYYLADAGLTIAWRLMRGERFWRPHRQHFYQRALAGADHAAVALAVAAGDLLLVASAMLALRRPMPALAGAVLVVAGLLAWMQRRAQHAHPHDPAAGRPQS
jgi:UDP-N-acetylmuramyl pentapeptide phosphotransferase/UDP-N-acetylglucosamine-1-phosphate transferase